MDLEAWQIQCMILTSYSIHFRDSHHSQSLVANQI